MKRVFFGSAVVAVFLYGVAVGRYHLFPYYPLKELKSRMTAVAAPLARDDSRPVAFVVPLHRAAHGPGYSDTSGRQEVACDSIDMAHAMVALAFGQSNSANYGETPHVAARAVYNFYDGRCYRAADPLLGASGTLGSVWTRLGDRLVDEGLYSSVLWISIGVGGTPVSRWTTGGDLFPRIVEVKEQLDRQQIRLTHLFWHQGESDGELGTSTAAYKAMFTDMLDGVRKLGIDAPLYMAVATRCKGPIRPDVHRAQLQLVEQRNDVLMGANTDTLSDMDDRYDFCHFTDAGLARHAELWLQSIREGVSVVGSRDTARP
jgi:hypothetical protein